MTGEGATGKVLVIRPGTSRTWRGFVVLVHLLAGAAVVAADLPLWLQSAGLLLGGLSLGREVRHGFPFWQPGDIRALALDSAGDWHLETEEGRLPAHLMPATRVWSIVIWLRFRTGRRRFWVLVPGDALPPDDFRRLKVRLRQSRYVDQSAQSRRGA